MHCAGIAEKDLQNSECCFFLLFISFASSDIYAVCGLFDFPLLITGYLPKGLEALTVLHCTHAYDIDDCFKQESLCKMSLYGLSQLTPSILSLPFWHVFMFSPCSLNIINEE
jgi:hypothetical protein